ncbi:hypothetical protein TNCV_1772691 [Trichonephila clavipes]|nr:hypothetical protein TNCV_1772691 [Trichonephila clavipes]
MIKANQLITIDGVEEDLGIEHERVKKSEIMSRDLNDRADEDDSYSKKIVTGDETWCCPKNPQTKRESSEWKAKALLRKEELRLDKRGWKMRRSN